MTGLIGWLGSGSGSVSGPGPPGSVSKFICGVGDVAVVDCATRWYLVWYDGCVGCSVGPWLVLCYYGSGIGVVLVVMGESGFGCVGGVCWLSWYWGLPVG